MSAEEYAQIVAQHAVLMQEVGNVYAVLAVACFIGLFFMLTMVGAAAWSVRIVNRRTDTRIADLATQFSDLSAKFSLLIDILLKQAEREIAARNVQIDAEHVNVERE